MFSDMEDYADENGTGFESYNDYGYSSPFSHWLEDEEEEESEGNNE